MKKRLVTYDNISKKLHNNPEKEERVKKYEEKYEIGKGSIIEDHPFYKDYLSRFNLDPRFELITPDGVVMSPQEWDLLARLVYGSFSSSYSFILDEEWKRNPTDKIRVHLSISVESGGAYTSKKLDELFTLQIERLFEIYVNEQIDLVVIYDDDDDEHLGPFGDFNDNSDRDEGRDERIESFEKKLNNLKSEADSYIKLQQLIHS